MKNSTRRLLVGRAKKLFFISEFILTRGSTGLSIVSIVMALIATLAVSLAPSTGVVIVASGIIALRVTIVSAIYVSGLAGEYTGGGVLFYYSLPISRREFALSLLLSYAVLPLSSLAASILIPLVALTPDLLSSPVVYVSLGYILLSSAMVIWVALMALSLRVGGGIVLVLVLVYMFIVPMVAGPLLLAFIGFTFINLQANQLASLFLLIALGLLLPGASMFLSAASINLPGGVAGISMTTFQEALLVDWLIVVVLYYLVYRRISSLEA